MLSAALLRGPVAIRVITLTSAAHSIAEASIITIDTITRLTMGRRWHGTGNCTGHCAGHASGDTRTGSRLRVGVKGVMKSRTTLRRPEVGDTFAITTIGAARSLEGAVGVIDARSAALISLQFGALVLGAALLRGPVVGRVVTVAPVTRSIADSISVTVDR